MIIAANATIRCPFMCRHRILADEEAGVLACDIADSLEELAEFAGKTLLPDGAVGVGFDKMAILEDIADDVVHDGIDEVDG